MMYNQAQNNFSHQRPRVHDYQPPAADIAEKMRNERRLHTSIKLSAEDAPEFICSADLHKRLENVLYDVKEFHIYDSASGELRFLRYIDSYLQKRLLSKLNDNDSFELGRYIDLVNKIIQEKYEKSIADTKARIEAGKAQQLKIDEDLKKVADFHKSKWTEKRLVQEQKIKADRVFTLEEENKLIHAQTWSLEDLERSKESLLNKKLNLKKEIKSLEKDINKLNSQIPPLQEEIKKLKAHLEHDNLTESDFKDIKISIEYNENKIQKISDKILPLSVENSELYIEVEKIDQQLKLLDVLIDKSALERDVFTNFPRRKERILIRLNKLLKEQTEIETLRQNLNLRWRELTNDNQELIPILGLKVDSNLYFI